MQIIKYMFQKHGDERGQLIALEENQDIPFEIKICINACNVIQSRLSFYLWTDY